MHFPLLKRYFVLFTRWKEECKMMSQKFESKVHEMHAELSQQKKKNAELSCLLHDMQSKITEVIINDILSW